MHVFRSRGTALSAALIPVLLTACGGRHHLKEYDFAQRSLAMVWAAPPTADLLTGPYGSSSAEHPVELVIQAGSQVAKELEARRARVRLDSAAVRVDVAELMAERTLDRASRYLGTRPVRAPAEASYLLELSVYELGIDARGDRAAYLYVDAEAVLLDAGTGREIWSEDIRGYDRLTPSLGAGPVPTDILTAGALGSLSVDDFERLLERLGNYASDRITNELREDLRDARDRG